MTTLAQGIEVEQSVISLPCRDSYGAPRKTSCQGRLRGVVQPLVGDGVTPATYPTLLSPKGFDFDGGDYITIPDDNQLSFGNGLTDSPFSWAAMWVPDSNAGNFCFQKNTEYYVATTGSPYRSRFSLFDNSAGGSCRVDSQDLIGMVGQLIFQAGTYDGSSTTAGMRMYTNGVALTQNPVIVAYTAMENLANNLLVGTGAGGYLNGKMYYFEIFPVELTPLQVSMLYARERSRLNT